MRIFVAISLVVMFACGDTDTDYSRRVVFDDPLFNFMKTKGVTNVLCSAAHDPIVDRYEYDEDQRTLANYYWGTRLVQFDSTSLPIAFVHSWDVRATFALRYNWVSRNILVQEWDSTTNFHWPFKPGTIGGPVRKVALIVNDVGQIRMGIDTASSSYELYTYSSGGQLLRHSSFFGNGEDFELQRQVEYDYDDNGDLRCFEEKSGNGRYHIQRVFSNGCLVSIKSIGLDLDKTCTCQ